MPIDLQKHVKIWVNPDGIIPQKIIERLQLQREVRPNDSITLFVNDACIKKAPSKTHSLQNAGVNIKVIERELGRAHTDAPWLVNWVKAVLEKGRETKDIIYSVYAADLLRMMLIVQEDGLYSDTDVFFLPEKEGIIDNISYLFGTHHEGGMGADVNVFGVDAYLRPSYYETLTTSLQAHIEGILGSVHAISAQNVYSLILLPSILYLPENLFKHEHEHTVLNFSQTKDSVLLQYEDHSWCDPQAKQWLYDDSKPDLLTFEVKKKLHLINVTLSHDTIKPEEHQCDKQNKITLSTSSIF